MCKTVKAIRKAAENIAEEFVSRYYPELGGGEYWPVGNDPMGTWLISDYFWNIEWMISALDLDMTEELLFQWWDDAIDGDKFITMKYFMMKNQSMGHE